MTDTYDGYENALLQWQQQQQRHLQLAENAATRVAKTLKARGVTFVEFDYYGSGDARLHRRLPDLR